MLQRAFRPSTYGIGYARRIAVAPQHAHDSDVGTHGPCVHAAWLINKQVDGVDELHAARYVGTHGLCVRARGIEDKYTEALERTHGLCVRAWGIEDKYTEALERTHEPCVPTCIRMEWSVAPVDNQRLETCVLILAILYGNHSYFTAQYNPYCTVKWVRLESHRADFETSHASCWFSTPILLHINPITSYYRR